MRLLLAALAVVAFLSVIGGLMGGRWVRPEKLPAHVPHALPLDRGPIHT